MSPDGDGNDATRVAADIAAWETLSRSPSVSEAPTLSVEGFEGPLDWLLAMVRAHKIDLARLPIAALVQSFVDALEAAIARRNGRAPDLAAWGDWVVMAASLAELRSRLLLAADDPDAKAARRDAEALRRQFVGRAQIRLAADWLEQRVELGVGVFRRGRPEVQGAARIADITDLFRACLAQIKLPPEEIERSASARLPLWRPSDAAARIETLIQDVPDPSPLEAFFPAVPREAANREVRCRAAVASTLVAGLELAKDGRVVLDQGDLWAPIAVAWTDRQRPSKPTSDRL